VCLTAFSDSCSNTACGGVYAIFSDTTAICDASFTLQGPTNPDDYGFIGVGNNQNSYHLWTFGDGTSSTLAMPFHGYDNPGTYEVCHITGIDGVCADTVCNTFYIGLYISGTINVGANCIDFGSVKLYSLDTISNSVELIGQYPMNNNLCYYDFTGLTPGIYLVRAGLSDSSSYYNDYVPTYFGSQFYWNDAEPIYLTQSGFLYNISLIYGSNPGGNGTVNGSIDDGPFRLSNPELSSAQSPVLGAQVIITDLAGVPQRWVRTDNSGAFTIPDLAYGTYRLMADEPGMTCLPIEFTLSEQTPGVTIDLVMGEEISGIVSYEASAIQANIYPNPSNSLANLNIELMKPASLTMTMTSITGQVTWTQTNSFLQGKSSIQIPVRGIADGLYFLSIYSDNGQLITSRKMQVAN
jgi:PKD repeat protein